VWSAADAVTAVEQIRAHFLCNALTAVQLWVGTHPRLAEQLIGLLAGYVQARLTPATVVPLRHEVEVVLTYLALERVRLGPRLRTRLAIAPETLAAAIPPLVLQPLVENAVVHGVSARPFGGTVEVHACRRRDRLLLLVADDRLPVAADGHRAERGSLGGGRPRPGLGLALRNVRRRLHLAYGRQGAVRVVRRFGRGWLAVASLPFEESGETEATAETVGPPAWPEERGQRSEQGHGGIDAGPRGGR
jgi:two-component system LytT family sensor kinase